jgi:hypothetical protein
MNDELTKDVNEVDTPKNDVEEVKTTTKPVEDIAKEVIAGMWGRGQVRITRLKEAGYDPVAVKAEVDKIFGN